jgi:hypothetical protein
MFWHCLLYHSFIFMSFQFEVQTRTRRTHLIVCMCWGSWSSEASPLSAHAGNLRHAYGFGLARGPFAA